MTHGEIASHYREIGARGSHPVSLVVKMYGAILEDFRRAMNAVAEGDIEARTACLNHALLIIAELQSVLDRARGKDVARHLNGFYDVTRTLIVEANLYSETQRIQKLVDFYLPLYHAWRQVEQDAYAGKLKFDDNADNQQQPATSRIVPASESSASTDPDVPRARWNA
jgi:flagellar biosynthetic protein FliS